MTFENAKLYWLKSNHKTVVELTEEEYHKRRESNVNYTLVVVWDSELMIFNKNNHIDIPSEQLKQIWGKKEVK